jgi:hypothetical protein
MISAEQNRRDAEKYRLAQANKLIRLGLVERTPDGGVRLVPGKKIPHGPDGKIVPDPVDIEAVELGRHG